jgi:hypothetical protein
MNTDTLGSVLTKAWQKYTGDGSDPANGQWYTTGANGDSIGLYGGLTDTIDSVVSVGTPSYTTPLDSLQPTVAMSSDIDNRNGLMTMPSSTTLSHTYSKSKSYSHTSTTSTRVGVSQQYSLHVGIPGESVGATTTFSFDETWTTSNTATDTTQEQTTFSQTVPVLPPAGKVYRALLTYIENSATVPYSLNLHCSGETETWYESRVNGHYNWSSDAGSLIGALTPSDYQAIGLDPTQWGVDGNDVYAACMTGTATLSLIGSFNVQVIDITNGAPSFKDGDLVASEELSSLIVPAWRANLGTGGATGGSGMLEYAAREAASAVKQPWRTGQAGKDPDDTLSGMATQEIDGCGELTVDNCPPAPTQQEGCTEEGCPTQDEGCNATQEGCGGDADTATPGGERTASARLRRQRLA